MIRPELVSPPGVEVRRSTDDEFDAWLAVIVDGSLHPDTSGFCPGTTSSPPRRSRTLNGTSPPRAAPATSPFGTAFSRAAPTYAPPTASPSSRARLPHPRIAATACRPPCSPRGCVDAREAGCDVAVDHHAAGLQVATERATARLRPSLHARHARQALTTALTHAAWGRRTLRAVCADPARCAWAHRRCRNASSRVSTAWSESVSVTCSAGTKRNAAPVARIWRR